MVKPVTFVYDIGNLLILRYTINRVKFNTSAKTPKKISAHRVLQILRNFTIIIVTR
jgi:hypothetical protein